MDPFKSDNQFQKKNQLYANLTDPDVIQNVYE